MRGEYALGKFLKSRYVEEYKLLNATYILKEVREYLSCLEWIRQWTNCWFSHDVTKIRTTKLLIFLIFYFHDV